MVTTCSSTFTMINNKNMPIKLTNLVTWPVASSLVSSPLWESSRYIQLQGHSTDASGLLVTKLLASIGVILESFVVYGVDQVALSFNGGKDCTVLLHVMVAALELYDAINKQPHSTDYSLLHSLPLTAEKVNVLITNWSMKKNEVILVEVPRITTLYVSPKNPFIEVDDFVQLCQNRYHLNIQRYPGPMREALQLFLDSTASKAILLGTRRTDPYSDHLQVCHPTDASWPSVMRVHPILDWSYNDIWRCIIDLRIPYCCLYDQGYTSLGGRDNTLPTECLRNSQRACGYDPAYYLLDESLERQGRIIQ